jgi:hypothetical protein
MDMNASSLFVLVLAAFSFRALAAGFVKADISPRWWAAARFQ